jgi:predicted RNA polymerase sigma factor
VAGVGRAEAQEEFERAASLTRNERERKLLLDRAAACARDSAAASVTKA